MVHNRLYDAFVVYVMEAQVWGGPRATKHTKLPPKEEAGPAELL